MTKHTPGPWETQPLSTRVRGPEGVLVCTTATSKKHAHVPVEQQIDNARLIAAAPDLLAGAKKLIASHDAPFRAPDYCQCTHCAPLRAAIAKAEG